MLEQAANIMAVVTVAVTDREKVAVTELKHMGICKVCVLVLLVRIMH